MDRPLVIVEGKETSERLQADCPACDSTPLRPANETMLEARSVVVWPDDAPPRSSSHAA